MLGVYVCERGVLDLISGNAQSNCRDISINFDLIRKIIFLLQVSHEMFGPCAVPWKEGMTCGPVKNPFHVSLVRLACQLRRGHRTTE